MIGLEYRFGLVRGWQAGIYRTSDRTIEFFTQYNVWQQTSKPVGLSVIASVDGTNNFKDSYTPTLGVVISRELAPTARFMSSRSGPTTPTSSL